MKLRLRICALAIALAVVMPAVAAEPDTMAQFDEALKAAATFEYGRDSGPLVRVEQIVVESATDAKLKTR